MLHLAGRKRVSWTGLSLVTLIRWTQLLDAPLLPFPNWMKALVANTGDHPGCQGLTLVNRAPDLEARNVAAQRLRRKAFWLLSGFGVVRIGRGEQACEEGGE